MLEEEGSNRQIALDLAVQCRNLGPNANPICGLFAIDHTTGQLVFLSHTEVMRAASNPKFSKFLNCNYFPGRNQKLQLNIYSAPWKDQEVDNSIHEEDRLGSVIIALDKVVPVNALDTKNFAPISVELPLWHDTNPGMNDKLQALGACMKIGFKYSENQSENNSLVGPKADQNIHQAFAIMLQGAEFLKYPFGSSGAPQVRFVWLDKNDGPMGTLYWCDPSKAKAKKKKKDKCIPLNTITGLFEQNQTDAFRKYQKLPKERMNRCFSVVGKERTLDLEGKTKELVDAFMAGIHRILSGSGFGVKEIVAAELDEESMSKPVVKNKFILKAKLRNLPPMPWGSSDDLNDTIITMEEKLPNAKKFKTIEQTDWQKGNSNPNFEKALVLPFTIPPTNHPIKFNVYDSQLNEKHLMGSSVVRLDFFYRYCGQDLMVKLRNAHDPRIDAMLTEANAYMMLTAEAEVPLTQFGVSNGTRSNFNSVVDEFKHRADGTGDGMKPSRLKPFFTRSTLAFMNAGCTVNLYSTNPNYMENNGQASMYFRAVEPCGQIILCNAKSGDVNGIDSSGNPKDPLLTIPMEWIQECIMGVTDGQFGADKSKKAISDNCLTLMYRHIEAGPQAPMQSIDIEMRDKGTRDAWATGIQEYISSVLEGNEGADADDLFSFIKGGAKRGGGGIAKKKLGETVDDSEQAAVGESLAKKFKPDDISKLGKSLLDEELDEETAGIDLFGKDAPRKKKLPLNTGPSTTVVGGGDVPMAPPIMAPDIVLGDGAPPPPPPPGAPGPPGAPPLMGFGAPKYNGPKLKKLHWEVLAPNDGAEGTLWSLIKDDLDKEGSAMLEELFKAAEIKKKDPNAAKEEDEKGTRLFDSKRANNIEIVLKSFRMPNNAIRDAILQVDTTILTTEKLQALLSMVPVDDEKKVLKQYLKSGKPVEKLGIAEQFALYMLELPHVDTRLRLLLFQAKFDAIVDEMSNQYGRLIGAGEKVKDSKELQKVMETILSVGNKLNAGTRTGGATAFRLAALDKLNDTKSADMKQTLLDFIVEYVDKHKKTPSEKEREKEPDPKDIDQAIMANIPSYLDGITLVKDAALVDWSALNAERETLLSGLQELTKEVEKLAQEKPVENDRFPEVMQQFMDHAIKKAKKMKKKYMDAQELIEAMFEYFGESESSFEPTDFFKLFDRFTNNYKQSELKLFQKRLRAKRDITRKENEANKKAAGSPANASAAASSSSNAPGMNNLAAMMAARRASLEGGANAKRNTSPDDDGWDEDEQKKPRAQEAKQNSDSKTRTPSATASAAPQASSAPSPH